MEGAQWRFSRRLYVRRGRRLLVQRFLLRSGLLDGMLIVVGRGPVRGSLSPLLHSVTRSSLCLGLDHW